MAAVASFYSRHVVGWSMNPTITAQMVTDAHIMASCAGSRPNRRRHHLDQGSQYAGAQFQQLMADHGITDSMSRSSKVWERTMEGAIGPSPMASTAIDSLFSSLKTERMACKVHKTKDDAKAHVAGCIERLCNPRRRRSMIGHLGPVEFENAALLA